MEVFHQKGIIIKKAVTRTSLYCFTSNENLSKSVLNKLTHIVKLQKTAELNLVICSNKYRSYL